MKRLLAICLLQALCLLVLASGAAQTEPFRLFDAMLFANRPDTSKLGFERLRIVDAHELWPLNGNEDAAPPRDNIAKIVADGAGPAGILVIDIENWNLISMATRDDARQKYIDTLNRFRRADPSVKLGLYGVLPDRNYWSAIGQNGAKGYRNWQEDNHFAAPIAAHVDALFPSLYTYYTDEAGWKKYAIANLHEARRIAHGKPVYCFLWPQYHDSGDHAFELLDGSYWNLQLTTCHKYADGIVIWGGYTDKNGFRALPWDGKASWWKATLQFTQQLRH